MIRAVGVVVPAHDEETTLAACLASIDVAVGAAPSTVAKAVVVVLDKCTDRSEAIARSWIRTSSVRAAVIAVDFGNVGKARARGMVEALDLLAPQDPATTWLATTDADSRVPAAWLTSQLDMAAAGIEAVAGSIRVEDWAGFTDSFRERFESFYEPPGSGDAHTHVHGANLGVRADAYLHVGGFGPERTGEDHALWNALDRAKRTRMSSRKLAVTTSARLVGRAPLGFSTFLTGFARRT